MNKNFWLSILNFRLPHSAKRRRRVFALAGVLSLTAIIALASIPSSDGVIYGCYKKSGGTLRVVDYPTAQCDNNETLISWNQTGPQGPAGPSGTSQVYALNAPGPFNVATTGGGGGNPLVATKDVPAGSYVIDVKLTAYNSDVNKHNIFCSLSTGDTAEATVPDRNFVFLPDGQIAFESVNLHDNYTFSAPGTIQVLCHGESMWVQHVVLTALKVDSIQ